VQRRSYDGECSIRRYAFTFLEFGKRHDHATSKKSARFSRGGEAVSTSVPITSKITSKSLPRP
jgi:hypothetical protein